VPFACILGRDETMSEHGPNSALSWPHSLGTYRGLITHSPIRSRETAFRGSFRLDASHGAGCRARWGRLVDLGLRVKRLRKYIERTPDGRELRIAYAMIETALPDPRPRSNWHEVAPFSAAEEILTEPGLKTVFKVAIERGFAIVARSDV
jgi:hypothetical protein